MFSKSLLGIFLQRVSGTDSHLQAVVHRAGIAFMLRIIAVGIAFAVTWLTARLLGADGSGVYYLAFATIGVGLTIGRLGLDNILLRFAAVYAAKDEWANVAIVHRKGLLSAGVASSIVAIVLFMSADWVGETLLNEPSVVIPLRIMSLAIIPTNLLLLYGQLLMGLERVGGALFFRDIAAPLLSLLLLPLLVSLMSVNGAALTYGLASLFWLPIAIIRWYRLIPRHLIIPADSVPSIRLLLSSSLPLLWIASSNLTMGMADVLLIGVWIDVEAVGLYTVAKRTAMLTAFILQVTNPVISPRFAALYEANEFAALNQLAKRAARLVTLITAPVVIVLLVAPKFILSLFGTEFIGASTALIILVLGQFVNVAVGSTGMLLIMTGHEKVLRNTSLFSSFLNVVLIIVLVPRFGIIGAAISGAASMIIKNLISIFLVKYYLSINMIAR